jgi:hypothetical protein
MISKQNRMIWPSAEKVCAVWASKQEKFHARSGPEHPFEAISQQYIGNFLRYPLITPPAILLRKAPCAKQIRISGERL